MIIICYRLIVFSAYWLLVVGGDEVFAIPWFSLKFLVFYNREKEPRSGAVAVPPPAPLSSVWLFIWIKKWDSKNFQL